MCGVCKSSITGLEHQSCIACQKPAPFGLTHPGCQTPHGADAFISFYDYHNDKLAKIIIAGKYNFIPHCYHILAKMLATKIQKEYSYVLLAEAFSLCPIPLHPSRKRWRGFNQAEILCDTLSAELNLPVAHVLTRHKKTKTQKDLKKEQRLKNVLDAFKLTPKADIRNKNIILVDDVATTGATLQEAAKVLKRNGASKIICLTVARD